MKVLMAPHLSSFGAEESGIKRVVEAYFKYLPQFGVELVDPKTTSYDILAAHAGCHTQPDVAHCHGLYFTGDYEAARWEWGVNKDVIDAIRHARRITVPSRWVAEIFQRDMRINPHVIGHGIDWDEWQGETQNDGYVLWNKNRDSDVCSTEHLGVLAGMSPKVRFVSTFAPHDNPCINITITGVQPHKKMKRMIQRAAVYLSTTKETFGIGVLEALASGVPVLGFRYGGNVDTVIHGTTGYLAEPGNYEDLKNGLEYCLKNREVLSHNARMMAKEWTWERQVEKVAGVYRLVEHPEPASVSVIIPCYKYGDKVESAVNSVLEQTYQPDYIFVVDDGSPDDGLTKRVVEKLHKKDQRVLYVRKENGGVATARNYGIAQVDSKYVCCLDADDTIDPYFLEVCVEELEKDRSLGAAYTSMRLVYDDGREGSTEWPGEYDYDLQLAGKNQVPTCCVFRRDLWERLGGYNQKYAPGGQGAEDAEFWLRMGAIGYGAKRASTAPMFVYNMNGATSKKEYKETNWRAGHPWCEDLIQPFASVATPKKISHAVHQYDNPVISVIIPVGPKHGIEVLNALDSLESQTFRKWEVILVDDTGEDHSLMADSLSGKGVLGKAYPYVRWTHAKKRGAGAARNAGVDIARGPFIMFLDADDWLFPEAMEKMIEEWNVRKAIIYTDYVGKAYVDNKEVNRLNQAGRLKYVDPKNGEAVISYRASEYDCERAVRQPDRDNYIWCLVTCLLPRAWHYDIGGMDENMPSWEDWDYWIRMARDGKCFFRLPEELVVYRFYTGGRRDEGYNNAQNLIQYLLDKYKGAKKMPCGGGCGKSVGFRPPMRELVNPNSQMKQEKIMADDDVVLVRYESGNVGQHNVVGGASHKSYGYRGGGETFLVRKIDVAANPGLFTILTQEAAVPQPAPTVPEPPKKVDEPAPVKVPVVQAPPPPAFLVEQANNTTDFDLQKLPGVSDEAARELQAAGIQTPTDVIEAGVEKLAECRGIGPARAAVIVEYCKKLTEGQPVRPKGRTVKPKKPQK